MGIICLQETCLKPFHGSQPKFKNYNCLRYDRLDSQNGRLSAGLDKFLNGIETSILNNEMLLILEDSYWGTSMLIAEAGVAVQL